MAIADTNADFMLDKNQIAQKANLAIAFHVIMVCLFQRKFKYQMLINLDIFLKSHKKKSTKCHIEEWFTS